MILIEDWEPSPGLRLEPNARIAIREVNACLALTAGPGAGKTEMLAQRADFLLRTGTCPYPWRILAIASKVDAALNLKARVRLRCTRDQARRLDSHTFHAFAKKIIDRYRPILRGKEALNPNYTVGSQRVTHEQITFEDMVPLALTIVESSQEVCNAVRMSYADVFLDEFQDCTGEQYALVRTLFRGTHVRLVAVGDTKQKIMGWAGALEGIFQIFAGDFEARPLNLYQNFRSLPRLRRMQNAMVRVMDAPAAIDDAEIAGTEGLVEIHHFADSFDEAVALADLVAVWINEEGIEPSDIAILVSKQLDIYAHELMTQLATRSIPYRNEAALQDQMAQPIARLMVDFLRVVVKEGEPDAYARLMDLLVTTGLDEEDDYRERSRWNAEIAGARDLLRGDTQPEFGLIRSVVEQFLARLGRSALRGLAPEYESGEFMTELIEQTFARLGEVFGARQNISLALDSLAEDRAVRLLTVHKCKGLEFDTVVVLAVEKELYWGKPDEERAAYFVAISRAKRRLLLTIADRREIPEGLKAKFWSEQRTPHVEFLGYAEGVM